MLEQGRIFADPLAMRILGSAVDAVVHDALERPDRTRMRIFIAVRTRFSEDALAFALEKGVRQIVVLGAGLDTIAYRGTFPNPSHVFEVDHPATQAWKRQCLEDAAIPIPDSLTFVPVDFEHQTLAQGLAAAGFDPKQETFFSWLGVVPYLKEETVWSTLNFIASLPNRTHVVFDYSDRPETLPTEWRADHEKNAARVADLGEAWVTFFTPAELHAKLRAIGFSEIEDLGPPQIAAHYFPNRRIEVPGKGGHILRATTIRT